VSNSMNGGVFDLFSSLRMVPLTLDIFGADFDLMYCLLELLSLWGSRNANTNVQHIYCNLL